MTGMLNRIFTQIKWQSREPGFADSVSTQWPILAALLAAFSLIGAILYATPRWQFFHNADLIWIRALDSLPLLQVIGDQFYRGSPWDYRPLTSLYLMMLHWIFGDWAPGFYVANLLVHSANGVLVYLIARRLRLAPSLAICAALIFVVHPAPFRNHAEVIYVTTVLEVHFTLWTVWLSLAAMEGQPRMWAASIFTSIGAMFSKESGATTVVLPLISGLLLRQTLPRIRMLMCLSLLLGLSIIYSFLSFANMPGWRERPDLYGFGTHVITNAAYNIGFLVTLGSLAAPLTEIFGAIIVVSTFWLFERRIAFPLLIGWLLLGSLPTAIFISPSGFDTTGRYSYGVLAPFALELVGLFGLVFSKIDRRWIGWLTWASIILLIAGMSTIAFSLAAPPFDTRPESILYGYVVLALMDYDRALDFLHYALGCPSSEQIERVVQWVPKIMGTDENDPQDDPQYKVAGHMVLGVSKAMLKDMNGANRDFAVALDVFRQTRKVELARGAAVKGDAVFRLAASWKENPPLLVCDPGPTR
jgi:hypothetical protein